MVCWCILGMARDAVRSSCCIVIECYIFPGLGSMTARTSPDIMVSRNIFLVARQAVYCIQPLHGRNGCHPMPGQYGRQCNLRHNGRPGVPGYGTRLQVFGVSKIFPGIMTGIAGCQYMLTHQWVKRMHCSCASRWEWDQPSGNHRYGNRISRLFPGHPA